MQHINIHTQRGLSLVELMISLTVASILSIAVLASFTSQASIFINQSRRTQSYDEGRMAFEALTRLIRHAESSSINISTNDGSKLAFSFTIPSGYPIWPNTSGSFSDNHIFVKWADQNDPSNGYAKHQIRLAKSSTSSMPAADQFVTLAGADQGANARITALILSLQGDNRNYRIGLTASAGKTAENSIVSSFDGLVMPRN